MPLFDALNQAFENSGQREDVNILLDHVERFPGFRFENINMRDPDATLLTVLSIRSAPYIGSFEERFITIMRYAGTIKDTEGLTHSHSRFLTMLEQRIFQDGQEDSTRKRHISNVIEYLAQGAQAAMASPGGAVISGNERVLFDWVVDYLEAGETQHVKRAFMTDAYSEDNSQTAGLRDQPQIVHRETREMLLQRIADLEMQLRATNHAISSLR